MEQLNIVFISCTDSYPHKFSANNTKIGLLAKGLIKFNDRVTIVNKYYGHNNTSDSKKNITGVDVFDYKTYKSKIFTSIWNLYKVIRDLKKIRRRDVKNIAIITCSSFIHNLVLIIALKIYGYKISSLIQEWSHAQKVPLLYKVNGWMHSYLIGYLVDSILPISEYIINKTRHFNKPFLKLPICAEFGNMNKNEIKWDFVYCASAGYKDAAIFILDSFVILAQESTNNSLCMILSGSESELDAIHDEIQRRNLLKNVTIKTKLSYFDLISTYQSAQALLIPQDPSCISEIARFSQKIAEYLSVGRPVLSNSVGEIKHYFTEGVNMFIANEYSPSAYAKLMKFVIDNPEKSTEVGLNGYNFGKNNFDYLVLSEHLDSFLSKEI